MLGTLYTSVCLSGREDVDTYQFTTPAGAAGGYAKVVLSNVRGASNSMKANAQGSNREIMNVSSETEGESLTGYFTVAPDEKFNVAVKRFIGWDELATYDIEIEFIAFVDAFEGNQTRDDAKSITAGTAIQAHLVALNGASMPIDEDDDDWYKVELPAGKATVEVAEVPTNVAITYRLLNAGGTVVDTAYREAGESLTRTDVEIATAGTYFVRIGAFHSPKKAGKGAAVPDNFTRKYTLKVSAN